MAVTVSPAAFIRLNFIAKGAAVFSTTSFGTQIAILNATASLNGFKSEM